MQAHSVGPQSSPSRSGIITGCYPSTYGMEWHRCQIPTPSDIFLPNQLRAAGYFCTNKSKTDYNTSCDNKAMWDVCGPNATYNNPKRGKNQPFFAVFNSMATHMGRIRSFHTDKRRDFALEGLDPNKLNLPPHVPDIPEIRSDFAFHMEGSQDIDKWVGIFLDDLKKQHLDENTIVFFFSDHGGCLPRGKGFLYETGTHVPLIVYLPPKWRHLANDTKGRTDRLIGFPDLAPTVLSLAGIQPPAYMQGEAFLGKYETTPKKYEFGVKANQASHYNPERSVTDGRYKLIVRYIPYKHDALMNAYQWGMPGNIWWDDTYLTGKCAGPVCAMPFEQHRAELFFDLEKDPYEIDNRIDDPAYATEINRLRNEISGFLRRTKDLGFFLKGQRLGKTPLYDDLRRENYDFEKLYNLVELTAKVSPKDLPFLTECLKSPRKEIRYWAVVNIGELADKGVLKKAPEALLALLRTDDAEVASEAAYALCLLGRHKEAMRYLTNTDHSAVLSRTDHDARTARHTPAGRYFLHGRSDRPAAQNGRPGQRPVGPEHDAVPHRRPQGPDQPATASGHGPLGKTLLPRRAQGQSGPPQTDSHPIHERKIIHTPHEQANQNFRTPFAMCGKHRPSSLFPVRNRPRNPT